MIQEVHLNRAISHLQFRERETRQHVGGKFETIFNAEDLFSHPENSLEGICLLVLLLGVSTGVANDTHQLAEYQLFRGEVEC